MQRMLTALCFALVATAIGAGPAAADGEQEGVAPAEPPSIVYGGSRSSSRWIALRSGTQVAVDEGITWKGVTVYLALTWTLVAVKAETGETLWDHDVSAYWNAMTFREIAPPGGETVWAVELGPGPRREDPEEPERHEYYELFTGRKIAMPGAEDVPAGEKVDLRASWGGEASEVAKPFHLLVSTAENWNQVRERLWGEAGGPDVGEIDFEKEVILVVSDGDGWNCRGVTFVGAWEDEARVLVRTGRSTYQTMGRGQRCRAWGVAVLPLRADKAYVVERNVQGLIGGPPIWKETWRTAGLPAPDHQLDVLARGYSDGEAGALLSAFVRDWQGEPDREGAPKVVLFVAQTLKPFRASDDSWEEQAAWLKEKLPGLGDETLASFHAASGTRLDLPSTMAAPDGLDVHYVSVEKLREMFQGARNSHDSDAVLRKLLQAHPGARWLLRMSAPGISPDGTQALLYASEELGARVATGYYFLLEKKDGAWHIAGKLVAWVS